MNLEIERKFLVTSNDYKKESYSNFYIKQGFLNSNKDRTVRVRLTDDKGYITVKGRSNASGTSRFEWEKEINIKDAKNLLLLCEKGIIEKIRHLVDYDNHIFEVDEFLGDNFGLVVAEVELKSELEMFEKPIWIENEVTGNSKYYNSQLIKKPYKDWKK